MKDKAFYIGVAVACYGLAALTVHHALEQRKIATQASVTSECTVIETSIGPRDPDSSSRPYPEVVLEHVVLGKTYRRTDTGPSEISSSEIKLPKVGSTIVCHYVPDHPDLVTIYPGKPTTTGAWFGLAAFICIVPPGAYLLDKRRRRRG